MIQSDIIDSYMDIKKTANLFIDFASKRLAEISGLLLFFLGLALFIALFTYSPEDPNFIFPDNTEIKNFFGFRGSFVSDLFFQSVGLIAYLISLTFIITGIKELKAAKVGDTVTLAGRTADRPLPGFKEVKPQVFAGLYPVESSEYDVMRDALEKLQLNDSSLQFEPEVSQALGFGFRCGFLGLLHMDIVQERLEREYKIDLITTAPTVVYQVLLQDGSLVEVDNPSKMPEASKIASIREPVMTVTVFVPQEYLGSVITLCTTKRGHQIGMTYAGRQVSLVYEIPMNEIVLDFFDKLKSTSRGYASMDYEFKEYRDSDVVKMDILINGDRVDTLSVIVHRANSQFKGRELAAKLRELIPRQMFDVAIQAAIGANIIARENVKALRKNVLAKCYGGDISRKRKLLEKQKAGKKRMKQVGTVEVPQEAFLAILKVDG